MSSWAAHAKVNLGLRITGVRADGYHELDSLFLSVDLHDVVTVVPGDARLTVTGPEAEGVPAGGTNLASRAAGGAHVAIAVEKNIPSGAGLGGGSADAAAVLHALGRGDDLAAGAELGADVPFCMTGGAARVRGIGDILEPVPVPDDLCVVLVVPSIRMATGAVYREWDRRGSGNPTMVVVPDLGPVGNDLAGPAMRLAPQLAAAADALERATGRPWLLTGSGTGLLLPVADVEEAGLVATRVKGRVLRPVPRGVAPLAG